MAAGGSAPEFFTSLISALQIPTTATGFGTVVGSAVFNVLFVIAMCALFSKEVLALTWWPLFRDCVYYAISLSILATFFACDQGPGYPYACSTEKGYITYYEAIILF